MSTGTLILTILSGAGALFGLAGCLFAAYRHPYKRWLYVITALLMAYFLWLVVKVVVASVTGITPSAPYFREAIGSMFFVVGLHGFFDGRLRGKR